jgi:acyl carrier protein
VAQASAAAPREVRWADLLREQDGDARRKTVLDLVQAQVAEVLGLDPDQPVPAGRGFFELGLDSLMALDLSRRIGRHAGAPLTPAAIFGHPTPEALTEHLLQRLDGQA